MKYYFLLHNSLNTKGENGIILRATEKVKSKYFSLGISTKEKYWDSKKKRVKKTDIMHQMKNQIINAFDHKAQKTILEYIVKDKALTLLKFIDALNNNYNGAYTSFFDFAITVSERKKKEITKNTYNNYQFQYNKLKEFKKDFALVDVDKSFINKYVFFLKDIKNNQDSTISKSLTYLRMILKEALDERLIEKSPFSDYKIKEIKTKDDFLTIEELRKLERLFENPKQEMTSNQIHTLKYFLFSCYTGIAFSDLEKLTFADIKSVSFDKKEYKLITNQRLKTGVKYRVPLSSKATSLLEKKFQNYQKLFKIFGNQVTNRHLKKLQSFAEINTNITFHLARHTYATHQINLGTKQKMLMEAMGHKSAKINDMYSKIQDETIVKEFFKHNPR